LLNDDGWLRELAGEGARLRELLGADAPGGLFTKLQKKRRRGDDLVDESNHG
jgi:hypothetical protein